MHRLWLTAIVLTPEIRRKSLFFIKHTIHGLAYYIIHERFMVGPWIANTNSILIKFRRCIIHSARYDNCCTDTGETVTMGCFKIQILWIFFMLFDRGQKKTKHRRKNYINTCNLELSLIFNEYLSNSNFPQTNVEKILRPKCKVFDLPALERVTTNIPRSLVYEILRFIENFKELYKYDIICRNKPCKTSNAKILQVFFYLFCVLFFFFTL